jgi:hypothetical protein
MLKKASSVVLATLKASDVQEKVRLGFWLAAALLEDLFEHPGCRLGHDQ